MRPSGDSAPVRTVLDPARAHSHADAAPPRLARARTAEHNDRTTWPTTRNDMIDPNAFAKLVPGFDFLNSLMQGAGGAAPTMGQWVAPTLNPDELEKRIGELKTLQFWLEQNARMMGMTIQALEVQRMTLSTLRSMNLPMADLRSALTLPKAPAETPSRAPAAAAPAPAPEPEAAAEPAPEAETEVPAKPAVDPMQWWSALTQQFTDIATKAMQDSSAIAARQPAAAAKKAAEPAAKPAAKAARKRSG